MADDNFSTFLDNPSEETFLRLRDDVLADPSYDFYSPGLDELTDLIDAEAYSAIAGALPGLMPGWLLSPRVHMLASIAAERTGDGDAARMERYFAQACLRGLLRSGAGSPERPYLVTHVADEYDVLEHLGKEAEGQKRVANDNGAFDCITCTDGSVLWFDVNASATTSA